MTAGDRVAAAALALVGAPFRLGGRDPARGLDCVGVAQAAVRAAGCDAEVPPRYLLRRATVPDGITMDGLMPCDGVAPGDVLLCRVATHQLHLVVRTADGFVHADGSLRRVVARPGAVPWPVERAWRVAGDAEGEG